VVLLITWHEPVSVCLETVDGGWARRDSLEAHCLDNAILDSFSWTFCCPSMVARLRIFVKKKNNYNVIKLRFYLIY